MVLYLVRYSLKGNDKREDLKAEHLAYLQTLYDEGKLLAAGLFQGKPGGYLLFAANNLEEAEAWVNGDPYILHGAREYEIDAWDTSPFPLQTP